jgi:hypothetical protein
VHGSAQALVQFCQRGVGLLGHQHQQAAAAFVGHLPGRTAAARLGGERTGFPATLQQAPDPGGADAEQLGKVLAGVAALVAGAHHPLAKVGRVGFQGVLLSYSFR